MSGEKNSITEAPDIKSEEQQHNYYFKAMKNEQEEINYVKGNGKFAYKYCFYDIDKNGIDELIVQGDYYNYAIYTLNGDKVEGLAWNKYGGNLKIYPTKGIFCWEGGHNNSEYIEYIGIKGTQAKEADNTFSLLFFMPFLFISTIMHVIVIRNIKKTVYIIFLFFIYIPSSLIHIC